VEPILVDNNDLAPRPSARNVVNLQDVKEGIIMSQKLVVIGGGAAGPSTAAEAKRRNKSLDVTMIEGGDFVSYAA